LNPAVAKKGKKRGRRAGRLEADEGTYRGTGKRRETTPQRGEDEKLLTARIVTLMPALREEKKMAMEDEGAKKPIREAEKTREVKLEKKGMVPPKTKGWWSYRGGR